jgi:hypothetical protein
MVTSERVRELLDYDPSTGVLTWKVMGSGMKRREAGCKRKDGRVIVRVDRIAYLRSRLAYLWMTGEWPTDEIDHINGDAGDDRWTNLRPATSLQQKHNRKVRKSSTTGLKGVLWSQRDNSWTARICVNGSNVHLGTFRTPEAAHEAYRAAAERHFGSFARLD